jgi:hypothetical protein
MHLGLITVIGRFADLAADFLADLRVTVVIMSPKKKSSPWQPAYKQKFGLRVTNRDVKTSAVIEALLRRSTRFANTLGGKLTWRTGSALRASRTRRMGPTSAPMS